MAINKFFISIAFRIILSSCKIQPRTQNHATWKISGRNNDALRVVNIDRRVKGFKSLHGPTYFSF